MKIHSTLPSIRGNMSCRQLFLCLSTVCAAVSFALATEGSALAQSQSVGDVSVDENLQGGNIRSGLITHGDQSYRVVKTAAFRTAADAGEVEAGTVAQVGYCRSGCGRSCRGDCGSTWVNPCAPCEPFGYVLAEALYMERGGNESFTTSADFRMQGFEYEWAGRITLGLVPDCVHGCELGFTGLFEWDRAGSVTDVGGGINTQLTPGAPFTAANISAFNNATFQSQFHEAEYWSVEANKTLVGWDVAKLLFGTRYIDYDELFNYTSQTATETGLLRSSAENKLYGVQVGMDLLYPICKHGYSDFRARLGAFVNFAESDVALVNDGNLQLSNSGDDEDLAGVFELSSGIRYHFSECLSVRAGTELWYIANVANATEQFGPTLTPATGQNTNIDDDILFTGLSLGAQLRY